jgi:hypothetical protein
VGPTFKKIEAPLDVAFADQAAWLAWFVLQK